MKEQSSPRVIRRAKAAKVELLAAAKAALQRRIKRLIKLENANITRLPLSEVPSSTAITYM